MRSHTKEKEVLDVVRLGLRAFTALEAGELVIWLVQAVWASKTRPLGGSWHEDGISGMLTAVFKSVSTPCASFRSKRKRVAALPLKILTLQVGEL